MAFPRPLPGGRSSSAVRSSQLPSPVAQGSLHPVQFMHPTASRWALSRTRRLLDLAVALVVLVLFAVPMVLLGVAVWLSSPGPVFFVQSRVGRGGRLFRIYKFRTMCMAAGEEEGLGLSAEGDDRVTLFGRWLRRFKLDELPQFYNVLRGEMSLIGPRPKLPQFADIVDMPYRPGITGAASLVFRGEEKLLARIQPAQLESFYNTYIRPIKGRIDVRYMCRSTPGSDLHLLLLTVLCCVRPTAHALSIPGITEVEMRVSSAHEEAAPRSFEAAS